MSVTRAAIRTRVRELLGDTNGDERQISSFRYLQSIHRNMHLIAARVNMPRSSVQSVSISVAGGYEYTTLTNTPQSVGLVLLNSTGAELAPVPWEQFNAYYRQDTAEPRDSGTPREYTMRENTSNGLVLRFGPTPDASDTVKVHISIIPDQPASDSTAVPFSDELARAWESAVAAELVSTIADDRLKALGVPRSAAGLFLKQMDEAIRDYNRRQGRLGTRQDHIMRGNRRAGSGHQFWGVW